LLSLICSHGAECCDVVFRQGARAQGRPDGEEAHGGAVFRLLITDVIPPSSFFISSFVIMRRLQAFYFFFFFLLMALVGSQPLDFSLFVNAMNRK